MQRCIITWLNGETIPATAGSGGIGIVEVEAFAVEAVGEIEFSAGQIQEALHVYYHLDAFIFKFLIHRFYFVVEIKFVRQAGTSTSGYRSPEPKTIGQLRVLLQL
jgi:hypothetical protein